MLSMAFPHGLLRFSNGIVNNFIVSFPLLLVYAQDVGRKPGRDARKTAESGFGAAPDPSTQFSLLCLYIFEHPTFHSAQDDEMRRGVEIMAMPEGLLIAASRFGFLSSTAGSPMKKISRFARNDDAGAGVSRCISLPVPSHLSPLPNLALPVFPLVKYK